MDISSIAGPAATLLTALVGLPLGQAALRRRETRLRDGIQANLGTIQKLRELKLNNGDSLNSALEQTLAIQVDNLLKIEQLYSKEKKRNWASLTMAFLLAAVFTTPLWFMWKPEHWYTWTIFVTLAVVALMLLVGGVGAWSTQAKQKEEAK